VSFVHPAQLTRTVIVALAMVALVEIVGGGLIQAAGAGGFGAASVLMVRRQRRHARRRRHADVLAARLPDVIELLAATVDGGVATDTALARVAEFMDEPMRSVLLDAVEQRGEYGTGARLCAVDPALRPLGSLLVQSEELGVPIAGSLRLLAADARARARSTARERGAAAAPKMLLVVGGLLAPASLLIVIGGQLLVLRDVAGGVLA
jgi:tight adherence protein C